MDNYNITEKRDFQDLQILSVHNFEFIEFLRKGQFLRVWKLNRRKNKNFFALKILSKAKIISEKLVASFMNERLLLEVLRHPFLINMIATFQDRENLYMVMDLLNGGVLLFILERIKNSLRSKNSLVHIQQLHQNIQILKQSLIFNSEGYLGLKKFQIARIYRPNNSSDTNGTHGFLALEVLFRQNHHNAVDYFAQQNHKQSDQLFYQQLQQHSQNFHLLIDYCCQTHQFLQILRSILQC